MYTNEIKYKWEIKKIFAINKMLIKELTELLLIW